MKVEIIRPYGFCYGVKRAFEIVKKAQNKHHDKEIYILGLLVHNDLILNKLESEKVKTVYSIEDIPNDQVVIFSAHGHKKELDEIAKNKNLIIYDATCDRVARVFDLIKKTSEKNRDIIYVGVKGHQECETALSLGENIYLYDIHDGFKKDVSLRNPLVINQTSIDIKSLSEAHDDIKNKYPSAEFSDEICDVTRIRQNNVLRLEKDVDYIIVLGDTKSSNTTRLFELAKENYQDITVKMLNDVKDLDIEVIKNRNHIVITSGTSTPDELCDEIYQTILNI